MDKRVCVVVGVGPGNGASIARRFCGSLAMPLRCSRDRPHSPEAFARTLGDAKAYACDVKSENDVLATFKRVR
jgi:NAD(P)-dependent dehydrogenase (short-subunit alcohol dehydrogenase family)